MAVDLYKTHDHSDIIDHGWFLWRDPETKIGKKTTINLDDLNLLAAKL